MQNLPTWLICSFFIIGIESALCLAVITLALLKQNADIRQLEKLALDAAVAISSSRGLPYPAGGQCYPAPPCDAADRTKTAFFDFNSNESRKPQL